MSKTTWEIENRIKEIDRILNSEEFKVIESTATETLKAIKAELERDLSGTFASEMSKKPSFYRGIVFQINQNDNDGSEYKYILGIYEHPEYNGLLDLLKGALTPDMVQGDRAEVEIKPMYE